MNTKELLESPSKLLPDERFTLIDVLVTSLDEPVARITRIWLEEAERRPNRAP